MSFHFLPFFFFSHYFHFLFFSNKHTSLVFDDVSRKYIFKEQKMWEERKHNIYGETNLINIGI